MPSADAAATAPGQPASAEPATARPSLAAALTFLATAGLLVAYALRGGSYDIVVRQEMALGIWWLLGLGFALGVLPRAPVPRVRLLGVATLLALAVWVAIGLGWTESAERSTAELARIVGYAGIVVLPLALLDRHTWLVAAHGLVAGVGAAAGILAVRGAPQIAHGSGGAGAGRVIVVLVLAGGLCAGIAWASGTMGGERWRLTPRPARALLASVLVALVVAGAIAGPSLARKAWHQFKQDPFKLGKQASAERSDPATHLSTLSGNRRELWASALAAFNAHPAGLGAGTFDFWWDPEARNQDFGRDAHSLYLQTLAEMGWPGLLLLVVFLGTLLWLAIRQRVRLRGPPAIGASAGLIAAFAAFLLTAGVDWMWESTAVTVLALLAVGTAIAVPAGADPVAAPGGAAAVAADGRSARLRVPWRVGMTLLAVLACLVELPGLVSTSEVRRSQSSVRTGAFDNALRQANDAIDAEPWAATPYVQRALVEERTGRLAAARVDLQRAMSREPTNWRHPLTLARVEAELGDSQAALHYYQRARRLHPLSPVFKPSLAKS